MGLSLADVVGDSKEIAIPFGTDVLHVTYRPGYHTPKFEAEYKRLLRDEEYGAGAVQTFLSLVTKWDLLDVSRKKVVPLTVEALADVPTKFLFDVIGACLKETNPPEGSGAA